VHASDVIQIVALAHPFPAGKIMKMNLPEGECLRQHANCTK